jgi:uncharacterized protein (DUF1501 family)
MQRHERDRRDFLKLLGLAGLGLAAPLRHPDVMAAEQRNAPYEGPYYIVFNASGGWDTTYLMDPKGAGGINRLYQEGDILTRGNHKFAPTDRHKTGGLSNEAFYEEFSSDLLAFNGLDYSVNNHGPGARYMATGKLDSLAYPTFAALVAACQGPTCPLSFLTFGNYSTTGNLVAMSRVPYLPSLQKLANADAVDGNDRFQYHDRFALDRIERTLLAANQAAAGSPRLPRAEHAENMLFAAQVNSQALSRVTPYIPRTMPREYLSQQVEVALASFKAGVCVSANLNLAQFDSHANNDREQMKLLPEFLAGVKYAMQRAGELQIRDKLVVIVQSEMGRTPTYNNGNGKDHWSIGSILFMGRGIRGNRVLGATDDKQFHVPVNSANMAIDREHGIRVRPEHIHQSLRELASIADHPYSRRFPLGVKDNERLRGLWG